MTVKYIFFISLCLVFPLVSLYGVVTLTIVCVPKIRTDNTRMITTGCPMLAIKRVTADYNAQIFILCLTLVWVSSCHFSSVV